METNSFIECKLDGTKFSSVPDLHAYLKRFKCSQKKYYETFHPRFDKLTGMLIAYKSYEQYIHTDFANKGNLQLWLKQNPQEGAIWAVEYLARRKKEKGLVYAPSQTELRSLTCPTMPYFNYAFKQGYYGLCEQLGFKTRFRDLPLAFTPLPTDAIAICDTREKTPVRLKIKTISEKLDVGDYGLKEPHDKKIYIDRKSLNDFIGTMGAKNLPRFEREVQRAVESGSYLVMMVEACITTALTFDEDPFIKKHVLASPEYIFHNVRDILNKYPDNLQICFCDGRIEMAKMIIKILELGQLVKFVDLQWKIERGEL